jgi:hypothetical protein
LETANTRSGPRASDRHRCDQGGVDAAGQTEEHRPEPVLAHVVAQPERDRRVGLREVVETLGRLADSDLVRGHRLGAHDGAPHQQSGEPLLRVRHGRRGGRQLQVDDQQLLLELGGARDLPAVGTHHDRVAIEDELVLTADHVDVRERRVALAGAAGAELEARVVLGPLERRGVDHQQQPGLGGGRHRGRPVLPDVLADGYRDVDAVDLDDLQRVAWHEVAVLVEDAVVG